MQRENRLGDNRTNLFRTPVSEAVKTRLAQSLALDAYGYRPLCVEGGKRVLDGGEVWVDPTGALFTRAAALAAIQSLVRSGCGQPYPNEWSGSLDSDQTGGDR